MCRGRREAKKKREMKEEREGGSEGKGEGGEKREWPTCATAASHASKSVGWNWTYLAGLPNNISPTSHAQIGPPPQSCSMPDEARGSVDRRRRMSDHHAD